MSLAPISWVKCHWLTEESKREDKLIFSKPDPFLTSNLSWKTLAFTSGTNPTSNSSLGFAFASFTTFILVMTCIVSAAFFWHCHQIISSSNSRVPLKCSSIYWHPPSVHLGSESQTPAFTDLSQQNLLFVPGNSSNTKLTQEAEMQKLIPYILPICYIYIGFV